MKLIPVIGLEIHVQLKTKSKMFCACKNVLGDANPNTAICPICLGYPGTLPVPNRQAIEWTQLAGAALNCELAKHAKFDRKSYFYPDLPKGYQITQFEEPFCLQGHFSIIVDGKERSIGITRIHLEEDAAKNIHTPHEKSTLIDYNRAGTPLMEIVTEPDIASPEEAKIFLQELQRVMRTLGISDADMESGQMRCDANISLKKKDEITLHPKTEIKNINSFKFVEKALLYEIERQSAMWEEKEIPQHATRGWNSKTGKTVSQRTKEAAADYRYFPEADIPPFVFEEADVQNIIKALPELPWEARERFMKEYGLTPVQSELLIENTDLAHFFEDTYSEIAQLDKERSDIAPNDIPHLATLAAKVLLQEFRLMWEEEFSAGREIRITPENFAELIVLLKQGKINSNAVKPMLLEMQRTGGDPDAVMQNLGLAQVSDTVELEKIVQEVISENTQVVESIKTGKEAGLQFLMGQVMAKTKGKANPKIVMEMLRKATRKSN
ncbi:MAG: Asp-tRNA(Asn)/Glu-tRNA(Gln) amidotransferase subunit GatB [bacterium]|nr:Asp-tRNA(Asn)/Glu-tRNA(Gln) amidotransferase subunit GatB [bacterium]